VSVSDAEDSDQPYIEVSREVIDELWQALQDEDNGNSK
jgi:hypothetical protein